MAPGYACPVCEAPQADAVHLANHLAVTASLGRTAHLEWLETHAPEWADDGPGELAATVAEYASELEGPEFEGDHGHSHGHDHAPGRPQLEDDLARQTRQPGRGGLTPDVQRVLEDARELTRRMYDGDEDGGGEDHAGENERDDDS